MTFTTCASRERSIWFFEEEFQRRLADEIDVFGAEFTVDDGDRHAVRDNLQSRRKRIFEAQLAGPLDVDLAFRPPPVTANLHESPIIVEFDEK